MSKPIPGPFWYFGKKRDPAEWPGPPPPPVRPMRPDYVFGDPGNDISDWKWLLWAAVGVLAGIAIIAGAVIGAGL